MTIAPHNEERLLKIILGPLVSEKATNLAEKYRQYAFKVAIDATKLEVKQAVEQLFNVAVERVQVSNLKGKSKRFGRIVGRRKDIKKAYVKLKEGQELALASVE